MIYHVEKKTIAGWSGVCQSTTDYELAKKICHRESTVGTSRVRVVSYDQCGRPYMHVVSWDSGWMPDA